MSFDWTGTAFVSTLGDVPTTLVPKPPITRLFVQVAHGTTVSQLDAGKIQQLQNAGFTICAWAWCNGDDVAGEAALHGRLARSYPAFVANLEEPFDAHGDSSSEKFLMPSQYLAVFLRLLGDAKTAIGLTTTPKFASHMTPWRDIGAVHMPQSFPTAAEGGHSVATVVAHSSRWGWPTTQIRPLVQTYAGKNGVRPQQVLQNAEATSAGVGVVPYTIEQALEAGGFPSITALRPSIERPTVPTVTPPTPEPPDVDVPRAVALAVKARHHLVSAKATYEQAASRGPSALRRTHPGLCEQALLDLIETLGGRDEA